MSSRFTSGTKKPRCGCSTRKPSRSSAVSAALTGVADSPNSSHSGRTLTCDPGTKRPLRIAWRSSPYAMLLRVLLGSDTAVLSAGGDREHTTDPARGEHARIQHRVVAY